MASPVPALPDAERRTAYTPVASVGPFNVGFALYGDSTDYGDWIEVYLNGALQSNSAYTVTSPSGVIGSIALPITDAQVTFYAAITGDLEIVGARRPRRLTQLTENRGVPARDLNVVLTEIEATMREMWDLRSRLLRVPPGETMPLLPPAATRANYPAAFNSAGALIPYSTAPGTAIISAILNSFLASATLSEALGHLNLQNYTVIPCAISGTATALVFTPDAAAPAFTALVDGMRFRGIPTATCTPVVTAQIVNSAGTPLAAKEIRSVDGYSNLLWGGIQKGKPLTVQYYAARDNFVICDPPTDFTQTIFGNGRVKLQSSSSSTLSLTQNDGHGLVVQNPLTSAFRLVHMPNITNANIFAAANYVEAVANRAYANNQLYSLYAANIDGTNDQSQVIDAWRTYTGVGVPAWNPTLNESGLYVKPTVAGGSSPDNSRTYVGILWTGTGDITTVLSGPVLQMFCQSHYNPWDFHFKTDTVTLSGITGTTYADQSSPRATIVTEGIESTPTIRLRANIQNNTAGALNKIRIKITGTTFDGQAFSDFSDEAKVSTPVNSYWVQAEVEWGVAMPMGIYTFQPQIVVSTGSATFELTMTGDFAI